MNIAIFGLGLIGGSIGRSILKNTDNVVLGSDIDKETILKAKLLRAITRELDESDYNKIDMAIVATCPNTAIDIIEKITPLLKDGTILIDCCGNKQKIVSVMKELANNYPKINFFGGHPMTGREFSGISHSTVNLLDKSYFLLVPIKPKIEILSKVKKFWLNLGCVGVVITNETVHDEIISYTSQLAHIVSSSYIKNPLSSRHVGYSAGSFRDLTRVAKLNSNMWTELMLDNRENLIGQIEDLQKRLEEYKIALQTNNSVQLRNLLQEGNDIKEYAEKIRRQGISYD